MTKTGTPVRGGVGCDAAEAPRMDRIFYLRKKEKKLTGN